MNEMTTIHHQVKHWNYRGLEELLPESFSEYVLDLYLKGNRIRRLPCCLDRLEYLRELHLNDNFLEELPSDLSSLKHLRCLDLSGNLLRTVPDSVCELKTLQYLHLNGNKMCELPLGLQNMDSLKIINVDDNDLLWLPQNIGKNFYQTQLSFWRNQNLHQIPFTVWLHVLPSRNIPEGNHLCYTDTLKPYSSPIRNAIKLETGQEIAYPPRFLQIDSVSFATPPKLHEFCLRKLYTLSRSYSDLPIPQFLIGELRRGPTALCDNPKCKRPLFESAIVITFLREAERKGRRTIYINSFLCSQSCSRQWMNLYKIGCINWKTMCGQ